MTVYNNTHFLVTTSHDLISEADIDGDNGWIELMFSMDETDNVFRLSLSVDKWTGWAVPDAIKELTETLDKFSDAVKIRFAEHL